MRTKLGRILAGLCLVFVALPLAAQEEETPPPPPEAPAVEAEEQAPPGGRPVKFFVEFEYWWAQPTGLDYTPASVRRSADDYDVALIEMPLDAKVRPRSRMGISFGEEIGMLVATYFAQSQSAELTRSEAGDFKFGAVQAFPLYAGVFDDGMADGFSSESRTRIRDFRIDFERRAFETPRLRATWYAGVRRINYQWDMETSYYALAPDPEIFPPIIPPLGYRPDLEPRPDYSKVVSEYEGRGVEAGLDFHLPFGPNARFTFEGGLGVTALRGRTDTWYQASTSAYAVVREGVVTEILAPPFDEFEAIDPEDPDNRPLLRVIQQIGLPVGLVSEHVSDSALIVEAHVGFRCRLWRTLEVYAGLRDSHYEGVGADVRPDRVAMTAAGAVNVQTLSRTELSTTIEGFYAGLGFLF